uniref:Dioxygenase n=1 Tax=Panagrolaimus sp. ES5 TaxID=591445 RepID=A0AC34FPA6_9BILA
MQVLDFTNLDCLFWKKDTPVLVRLLDKRTGKEVEQKFRHAPFFVFHHANAFEKDGCLVVDYCQFSHPDLHMFDLENMRKGSLSAAQMKDQLAFGSRMIIPIDIEIDNAIDQLAFGSRMIIPIDIEIDSAIVGDDFLKGKGFEKGCKAILKEDGEIWLEQQILSDIGGFDWRDSTSLI